MGSLIFFTHNVCNVEYLSSLVVFILIYIELRSTIYSSRSGCHRFDMLLAIN